MNHALLIGQGLFFLLIAILAAALVLMNSQLKKSIRKTLYSYTNIGLIGGILFAWILLIVCLVYCMRGLILKDVTPSSVFHAILAFPRHFSYYAVFFMIAVCVLLAISNIALIRHEGLHLHNALSIVLAVFYIGGTLLIYQISHILETKIFVAEQSKWGRGFLMINTDISLFMLLMLCYFECIFFGAAFLGYQAAKTKPSLDKDYIIILGCSIDKRGGLLPLLKGRVNRAIRFAWEQEIATGKPMKYVPSGGQGPNEVISEGSAMELYLLSHGAEQDEVLAEKKSRNTWENFCFSKKIIDEQMPDAKVAFATTNYHILRSGILAQKAGIDAEGIAGDTKWYFWPNGFIREFFGILKLNTKAHIKTAVIVALICLTLGLIGYFCGL